MSCNWSHSPVSGVELLEAIAISCILSAIAVFLAMTISYALRALLRSCSTRRTALPLVVEYDEWGAPRAIRIDRG